VVDFQNVEAFSSNITLFSKIFFGVPHLATCVFLIFKQLTVLGARIDLGMAYTPFPGSILNETRFEPTTF